MLDFRVETFLAVCRHMNFTRAARELSITQPAVSHHIRYLEQAYGAALFRHNGKRLQLTEAGEILRRTLLTMKHDEQHLQKRMQQAATGTRDYSFGATLSVAEFMLNEALGRFLHLHPDSRIRMQVADTKVLLSKLDSGELDFAVVEGDFPKAEYDFFVFGTEEYVAAAAPDKAARYRGRQLTQMLDEPLLLREEGSGTRVILEYYLKERGLAAADFARTVEIGNIGAIKTLLKSGYGVSFLYRAAIRPEEAAARDPTPQQKGSHRSARPGAAVAFQFTFRQLLTNATATSIWVDRPEMMSDFPCVRGNCSTPEIGEIRLTSNPEPKGSPFSETGQYNSFATI